MKVMQFSEIQIEINHRDLIVFWFTIKMSLIESAFQKITAILLILCFIWLLDRYNLINERMQKVYQRGKVIFYFPTEKVIYLY